MNIEREVNRLRWQLRTLVAALIVAVVAAAAPTENKHRLEIKSPDGKSSILINVKDDVCGIWIRRGDRKPYVALWNSDAMGAAVGVAGPNPLGAPDAILTSDANGGTIYLNDAERNSHRITADNFIK